MIPEREVNLFKTYIANTPARLQSGPGWSKYLKANSGPAGAYDAKPGRRLPSFEELYRVRLGPRGETIALDQHNPQRDGPLQVDADPPPQHLVETDAEPPVEHEIRGRAPPPHDEPAGRGVREPDTTMGLDPPTSEAQRKAMGAAASGHSNLGIPREVGERFLHEDAALETVTHGQQGAEVGPEDWERTRGRDQAHEDREEDEALIAKVLERLGYSSPHVQKAIADRARKARDQGPLPFPGRPSAFEGSPHGKLAGDSASFARMYGAHAAELMSGQPAITPRVFIDRRRGR
jgi:hypothetical protein